MSTMYGADVAQLRALAAQFDRAADQLDRGRLEVGNGIRIRAWVGPFAATFRLRWDSEHSLRVAATARLLRENARRARANADEQERTSAVDGGPGGAGGYAPYPPPEGVQVTKGKTVAEDPPRGAWDPSQIIREFDREGTYTSGVSIRTIIRPDGSKAHILYIPGTQDWFSHSDNVYDGVDNLAAVAQQRTKALEAVLEAMRQHGIGPDEPVMFTGHSQGALIAGNLAADADVRANYNVEGVVVYGADIRGRAIPPEVAVTQVANAADIVTNVTNPIGNNGIRNFNDVQFHHISLRTEHEMDESFWGRVHNAREALTNVITSPVTEHTNTGDYAGAAINWYSDNRDEWDREYGSFKGGGGSTSTMTRYSFKE
ncbi:MAG: alpha/beta hydrolase [Propionicimonas sp.]